MDTLWLALQSALALILNPTAELMAIVTRTLMISGSALVLASVLGVAMAALVGFGRFPLRGFIISVLNALMGLPPVVAGLFIYILLSRSGPLGFMGLLYSPSAMVAAQMLLATPIVAALGLSAIEGVRPSVRAAARTLGARPAQEAWLVIGEARYGMLAAIIAAFGRVMAEVGAILIVGGNIRGYTRVMTTTIAMETDKGDFRLALALGIILLAIAVLVNVGLHVVQSRGRLSERGVVR